MKRSDLTTQKVVETIDRWRFRAWEYLCLQYPPKIVYAAFLRDVRKGVLDYGVCVERPWIERRPVR